MASATGAVRQTSLEQVMDGLGVVEPWGDSKTRFLFLDSTFFDRMFKSREEEMNSLGLESKEGLFNRTVDLIKDLKPDIISYREKQGALPSYISTIDKIGAALNLVPVFQRVRGETDSFECVTLFNGKEFTCSEDNVFPKSWERRVGRQIAFNTFCPKGKIKNRPDEIKQPSFSLCNDPFGSSDPDESFKLLKDYHNHVRQSLDSGPTSSIVRSGFEDLLNSASFGLKERPSKTADGQKWFQDAAFESFKVDGKNGLDSLATVVEMHSRWLPYSILMQAAMKIGKPYDFFNLYPTPFDEAVAYAIIDERRPTSQHADLWPSGDAYSAYLLERDQAYEDLKRKRNIALKAMGAPETYLLREY